MTEVLLVIITILLIVILVGVFLVWNKFSRSQDDKGIERLKETLLLTYQNQDEKLDRTRKELLDRFFEQNKILNDQLHNSQKSLQQQFAITQKDKEETTKLTAQILKEVTEKMTKLDETNKQIVGFAGQLQSLENILKNPKQRGILGEYFLETVLKNVLPPGSFQMQYKFLDGMIVDAAVFVKDKIIPIDAKFSLENYNRIVAETNEVERTRLEKEFKSDLKKRIDETSKYIRPFDGTMDFAFMFIPSEGIYYDLLINQVGAIKINTRDLIEYAFVEKKVIVVSPTSFLAYLQTVLQGLRSLQIEDSAKLIIEKVEKLKTHIQSFEENFDKVGKHLGTTVSAYNKSHKELTKIDKDFLRLTDSGLEIAAEEISDVETD